MYRKTFYKIWDHLWYCSISDIEEAFSLKKCQLGGVDLFVNFNKNAKNLGNINFNFVVVAPKAINIEALSELKLSSNEMHLNLLIFSSCFFKFIS